MSGALGQLAPAAADPLGVSVPRVHPARGPAPVGVHPNLHQPRQSAGLLLIELQTIQDQSGNSSRCEIGIRRRKGHQGRVAWLA